MPTVIKASSIITPDGVERELRFTLGAEKRIHDLYGKPTMAVFQDQGDSAIPGLVWAMLHDAKGNPPVGYDSPAALAEEICPQDRVEYGAALLHAISNCSVEKKTIETALKTAMGISQDLIGSNSEPTPSSVSESSMMPDSGGLPQENSMRSADGIDTSNVAPTPELELSLVP